MLMLYNDTRYESHILNSDWDCSEYYYRIKHVKTNVFPDTVWKTSIIGKSSIVDAFYERSVLAALKRFK